MMLPLLPIPSVPFPENTALRSPTDESLVCLSEKDGFLLSPQYYLQGIPGADKKMFVRQSVYERLVSASALLPNGFRFVIFDAWRPYAVQRGLFDAYCHVLREKDPGIDEDTILKNARQFVSPPSKDPAFPAVHSTGGAVDLTIADEQGRLLDMGSSFDDFTESAHTDAFENTAGIVRDNRRLLYTVMLHSGFTNFPCEWWHYDFGDGFWAFYKKKEPLFAGIPE